MGRKIEPELLGQVLARLTGREHILSGGLPHGYTFNTYTLWGDESAYVNNLNPPPPYYLHT